MIAKQHLSIINQAMSAVKHRLHIYYAHNNKVEFTHITLGFSLQLFRCSDARRQFAKCSVRKFTRTARHTHATTVNTWLVGCVMRYCGERVNKPTTDVCFNSYSEFCQRWSACATFLARFVIGGILVAGWELKESFWRNVFNLYKLIQI